MKNKGKNSVFAKVMAGILAGLFVISAAAMTIMYIVAM